MVLVLAKDECVRLTCAEVLTRSGVAAAPGEWPPQAGERSPDAIVVWEASEADVAAIRAMHADVPVVVCTWGREGRWPDSVAVVRLPFNAERVARLVEHKVRETRKLSAAASAH